MSGIKVMAEALEIKLEDLRKWLDQETVSIIEPFKTEGKSILDEIKAKLDDLTETSDK